MPRRPRRLETMLDQAACKKRLKELIDLAQTYRGWSNKEIAAALHRDAHNLIPESGLPKIDIVRYLSEALEWSAQDVLDDLWGVVPRPVALTSVEDWATLDRHALAAFEAGEFDAVVEISRREYAAASTGEQRARACGREFLGHEGRGRYGLALQATQRGLRESDRTIETTNVLRLDLATSHYVLGNAHEAIGVAATLIQDIEAGCAGTRDIDGMLGFAHFVRGNAFRVVAGAEPLLRERTAGQAIESLTIANDLLLAAAAENRPAMFRGAAEVCRGGILEMHALLCVRSPDDVIREFMASLDDAVDIDGIEKHRLEAIGWWCIFAANLVLRHVGDPALAEQLLGIFTNKADEVATRLGNWALRERVWTLELMRRTAPSTPPSTAMDDWVIDADDARELTGTMSRFPVFRETGWQILRSAKIAGGVA